MKYDVEKRGDLVREETRAETTGEEIAPPERRCEERLRYLEAVLHDMVDGVIVAGRDGYVDYMNPAAMELFGLRTPGEGARYFQDTSHYDVIDDTGELLPPDRWPLIRAMRGEAFSGQEVTFKDNATGRKIPVTCDSAPLNNTGLADMSVITLHARTVKKAPMSIAPGMLPLLGIIAASVPEAIMATGCDILLYDDRNGVFRSIVAFSGWQRTPAEQEAVCAAEADKTQYARRVMESRNPLVIAGSKHHPLCTSPGSKADRLGVKSMIALPLEKNGRFLGAMILDSTRGRREIGDRGMETLTALAKFASAMISRAESMTMAATA